MDLGLKDKIAIVTGSTGICKETALSLAREGVNIAITYLTEEDEKASRDTISKIRAMNQEAISIKMNLLSLNEISVMVTKVLEKFSRIDILINCAGTVTAKLAENITENEWDLDNNVDLKGLFYCCQEVFKKAMKKQENGNIVNIASVVGMRPIKTNPAYGVAKAGVIHISEYLAIEWGPYNVKVNSISPGWIATKLLVSRIKKGLSIDPSPIMPIGRLGNAREIAEVITFMVSEKNSFMTGTNVISDGGILAGIRVPSVKNNKLEIL